MTAGLVRRRTLANVSQCESLTTRIRITWGDCEKCEFRPSSRLMEAELWGRDRLGFLNSEQNAFSDSDATRVCNPLIHGRILLKVVQRERTSRIHTCVCTHMCRHIYRLSTNIHRYGCLYVYLHISDWLILRNWHMWFWTRASPKSARQPGRLETQGRVGDTARVQRHSAGRIPSSLLVINLSSIKAFN